MSHPSKRKNGMTVTLTYDGVWYAASTDAGPHKNWAIGEYGNTPADALRRLANSIDRNIKDWK
jgi:hypothetical protein